MPNIVKADPRSTVGAKLLMMAMGQTAHALIGSRDVRTVERVMRKLWRADRNRFSHEYAYEAKHADETMGFVTCCPASRLEQLAWPTFTRLLAYRKLPLIAYHLLHPRQLLALTGLKEGLSDEFHIAALATMPHGRGLGIGSKLIAFAEEEALRQRFTACSLTVSLGNPDARRLYERLGYRVTDELPGLSLQRMRKALI